MFCTVCAAANEPNETSAGRCAVCGSAVARRPPPSGWRSDVAGRASARTAVRRALVFGPLVALLVLGTSVGLQLRDVGAERASWYAQATAAAAVGDYPAAISAYTSAAGYRDADARRAAAVAAMDPYQTAYLDGIAALSAGRYDAAIAALLPVVRDLPLYEDAAVRLGEARRGRETELARTADVAAGRHDWLTAERALAHLAAADPNDERWAQRLAALQRAHAPFVFARDGALYLIGPDMADERLVTDEVPAAWPAWSPDRTRIAFISRDQTDANEQVGLYVIGADGTGLTKIADRLLAIAAPAWSPDGTKIAYTGLVPDEGVNRGTAVAVRVVEVATQRLTDLTADALFQAGLPSWSPSGDRLAFLSRISISAANDNGRPGTSEVHVATLATGEIANVGRGRVPNASVVLWSPTDDRLLIHARGSPGWQTSDSSRIVLLDVDSGDLSEIGRTTQHVSAPVWSPDGSRFAFVEGETLVRVRSRGIAEARITVEHRLSGFLTWSPDGSDLIAGPADPTHASTLIPLDGQRGAAGPQAALPLRYDAAGPEAGPPVWSPTHPMPVAGEPSVAGTALDHGKVAGVERPTSGGDIGMATRDERDG
jgi:hypothetical protein